MKKFSEFPQATSLTDSDLLLISQYDGVSAYETKYITANLAESVSKKEFIARIEQSLTNAPTITVVKDDFGDTYTTAYVTVGRYQIDGFNNELDADVEVSVNTSKMALGNYISAKYLDADSVQIDTADNTLTSANTLITQGTYIRVTKYL